MGSGLSSTIVEMCGDATVSTVASLTASYSAVPSVASAQVIFGDLNPIDLINSILDVCSNACPSSSSVTASYVPYTAPDVETTTVSGAASTYTGVEANPTAVVISYSITSTTKKTDIGYFQQVLDILGTQGSSNQTFDWLNVIASSNQDTNGGSEDLNPTTQYVGPSQIGVSRFQNLNVEVGETGTLADQVSIFFSSEIKNTVPLTCSESKLDHLVN